MWWMSGVVDVVQLKKKNKILWLSAGSGYSEEKRVGGEIVEQGWIVSVPWGIVPGGDLRTAEGERGEGVS